MLIDLRVLELLSSKLCHDLISPVSAINNGVELIEDIGGDVVEEAMKLIGDSAGQAGKRLKLYRMAYGRAGSDETLPLREVRPIAEQYLQGSKTILRWAETQPAQVFLDQRGAFKTLVNMVVLAEEILAYGGIVTVNPYEESGKAGYKIEIIGRNAHISTSFQEALEGRGDVMDITPRTIQPYITGRFAAHFELMIRHAQISDDQLDIYLLVATV